MLCCAINTNAYKDVQIFTYSRNSKTYNMHMHSSCLSGYVNENVEQNLSNSEGMRVCIELRFRLKLHRSSRFVVLVWNFILRKAHV